MYVVDGNFFGGMKLSWLSTRRLRLTTATGGMPAKEEVEEEEEEEAFLRDLF